MPAEAVKQRVLAQVQGLDRAVFHDMLTDAVANKPTEKAWRTLAERNPHRYVQSVQGLAGLSGYAQKTEHIQTKRTIHETVTLIVAQRGLEAAKQMLEGAGLPLSLLDPHIIEGTAEEIQSPEARLVHKE